jgi:hypothetical protein
VVGKVLCGFNCPAFCRDTVTPVPRNVWLQIVSGRPTGRFSPMEIMRWVESPRSERGLCNGHTDTRCIRLCYGEVHSLSDPSRRAPGGRDNKPPPAAGDDIARAGCQNFTAFGVDD